MEQKPCLESSDTERPLDAFVFKIFVSLQHLHTSASMCTFWNISGIHHALHPATQSSDPLDLSLHPWSDKLSASSLSMERDKSYASLKVSGSITAEFEVIKA